MPTILIVDDEPRILGFLQRALSAGGFDIETAGDGRSALQMMESQNYDLVLLDLVLPGMDGVSVLRELRNIRDDLGVVVMSALCDVRAKVECLDLGAVDYVTKPFALAELIARVNARLREPGDARTGRLRAGRMSLDVTRRTVTANGNTVTLTPTEFRLLEHLTRNAGRVCPREELLEAVWEPEGEAASSNVIDACVRRLRSKVGADAIETVRNAGYRLAAA
jgi:DNA-binding response OmpR family regulator